MRSEELPNVFSCSTGKLRSDDCRPPERRSIGGAPRGLVGGGGAALGSSSAGAPKGLFGDQRLGACGVGQKLSCKCMYLPRVAKENTMRRGMPRVAKRGGHAMCHQGRCEEEGMVRRVRKGPSGHGQYGTGSTYTIGCAIKIFSSCSAACSRHSLTKRSRATSGWM